MAATVLVLDETVEIYLHLLIGNRSKLGASRSVSLLPNRIDQAKGVTGRLEGIEVGPVSEFASEVLVAEPQEGG